MAASLALALRAGRSTLRNGHLAWNTQHCGFVLCSQAGHLQEVVGSDRISCFRKANTRSSVALGSSTHGLGGNAHGAGHVVQFRLAWARNLPGTALRQHPSAEDCPFRFREGETKASKSAKTELHAPCSSRTIRWAFPACEPICTVLEELLASCSKLQLWKCAGQKIAVP